MARLIPARLVGDDRIPSPRHIARRSMLNVSGGLALLLGSLLACQVLAFEGLLGEYSGKLKAVDGYGGSVGDACTVVIGTSDMYGGSLVFEISGAEKILMQKRDVEQALQPKSKNVKLHTPANMGTHQRGETVVMTLGEDGGLKGLKLWVKQPREFNAKTAICGELSKK